MYLVHHLLKLMINLIIGLHLVYLIELRSLEVNVVLEALLELEHLLVPKKTKVMIFVKDNVYVYTFG